MKLLKRNHFARRGIAVVVTIAMSAALFPIVGLVLDAAVLYVVKTELSSAADATSLAAARSLSRGIDFNTQKTNAQATGQNYFRANFPNGFFMSASSSANVDVTLSGTNVRVVTTTATATVPLTFMRMLPNWPSVSTVNASATATRRDSNVVLVIDRSKSLADSNSCEAMKTAAAGFVDKFAEQSDFLGLVTFASSSYYMDYPVATNFKSSSPSLATIIGNINCVGGTNSAQGLWNGYTALANLAQPGALNVIVFFTDGQPTALPGTFSIKGSSSCTDKTNRNAVLTMTTTPTAYGLLNFSNGPVPIADDNLTLNGDNNCNWKKTGATAVASDVSAIPASDYFGDNTNTGYAGSVNLALGSNNSTNANSIKNAALNAADEAAKHIRKGDQVTKVLPGAPAGAVGKSLSGVVIFSIGLGNSTDPPNVGFLKRVANTSDAVGYDSSKQTGLYVEAQTTADLQDAFERVAAEVLRLAK